MSDPLPQSYLCATLNSIMDERQDINVGKQTLTSLSPAWRQKCSFMCTVRVLNWLVMQESIFTTAFQASFIFMKPAKRFSTWSAFFLFFNLPFHIFYIFPAERWWEEKLFQFHQYWEQLHPLFLSLLLHSCCCFKKEKRGVSSSKGHGGYTQWFPPSRRKLSRPCFSGEQRKGQ